MNRLLLLFFFFLVFARGAEPSTPFQLPTSAAGIRTDHSGQTWNMTGTLPFPIQKAEKEMRNRIEKEKFIFLHEIPMKSDGSRKLFAWKKADQRLILQLWKIDSRKTGFAWGMMAE